MSESKTPPEMLALIDASIERNGKYTFDRSLVEEVEQHGNPKSLSLFIARKTLAILDEMKRGSEMKDSFSNFYMFLDDVIGNHFPSLLKNENLVQIIYDGQLLWEAPNVNHGPDLEKMREWAKSLIPQSMDQSQTL